MLAIFSYQSTYAQSAAADFPRILILHGAWEHDSWEKKFDDTFLSGALEAFGGDVQTSSQYLGLDQASSPETRRRLQENVDWIIEQQSVNLVVATLPAAIEFFQEMPISEQLPAVLTAPRQQQQLRMANSHTAVLSSGRQALERTLSHMNQLLDNVNTIEVFSGNSDIDSAYVDRFRSIAEQFEDRFSFNYTIGKDRETLIEKAGALGENTAIILLSYETYGEPRQATGKNSIRLISSASAVPVFGTIESQMDQGIVGGSVSTARETANAALQQAIKIIEEQPTETVIQQPTTIYNYDPISRWNLPISRLEETIEIRGEPSGLFRDYPIFTTIGINAILLLSFGLAVLTIMYRRSETAKARIESSELAARESEEKYRLLAANLADVIWVLEEGDYCLKYCSPSIQSISGYTDEEFMQIPLEDMMPRDDLRKLSRALTENTADVVISELLLRHKDGSKVWVEMVIRVSQVLPDGRCEWVGVTRDISKRKENEREKLQLEEQVRQSQKFESLGTLAGGIAHDFNNILTVIFGVNDMLRLQLKEDPKTDKLLDRLSNASRKARSLVQQILTFSRQSSGDKEVIDALNVLDDCVNLILPGKPINISLNITSYGDQFPIVANKNQLEQTLINLITNALDAVHEDSGKILIQLRAEKIQSPKNLLHGELQAGNYVHIEVIDNGEGMSGAVIDKIFDPFFTSKELGNGMGLAIVHGIVMDHAGAIEIESEVGKGTSVHIYLPMAKDIPATEPKEPSTIAMTSQRKRILVVDDQEELLQVAKEMLKQLGHDCVTCSNSAQARTYLAGKAQDVDLMITDYSMPGENGVELMQYCNETWPSLPVIISTGYGEQITHHSNESDQYFGVLDKPYTIKQLQELIESVPTMAIGN